MNRAAELLRTRLTRNIGDVCSVIRRVAVSTPVTLECASSDVDNSNAAILIAISEVSFIRFDIDRDFSYAREVSLAIAVSAFALHADSADVLTVA